MNRPDDELARKIAQQLDHGVERLNPATRERLAAARKLALSRFRERPETVSGLAWAMNAISHKGDQRSHGARYLIAIAGLVLALLLFPSSPPIPPPHFSHTHTY